MFEQLFASVSRQLLLEAAYYAVRLIRYRHVLVDIKGGFIIKDLKSEPSPEVEGIAMKVIEEIEGVEGDSVSNLSEEKAEEYVNALMDLVRERSTKELQLDKSRGHTFLDALRSSSDPRSVDLGQAASSCYNRLLNIQRAAAGPDTQELNDELWYLGPEYDRYGDAIATSNQSNEHRSIYDRIRPILLEHELGQIDQVINDLATLLR